MPLRAYGSTPAVGSSRITTFEPPTKARATDSFLCIPPINTTGRQSQNDSLQMSNITCEKTKTLQGIKILILTRQRAGAGLSFVRQSDIIHDVLHLGLHLLLRQPLQTSVEPDVFLHRQPGFTVNQQIKQLPKEHQTTLRMCKELGSRCCVRTC